MYDVVILAMQVLEGLQDLLSVSTDGPLWYLTEFSVCSLQRVWHQLHVNRRFVLLFVSNAAIVGYNIIVGKLSEQLALLGKLLLQVFFLHSYDFNRHLRWKSVFAAATLTTTLVHALINTAEGSFTKLIAPLDSHKLELPLLINLNRRHRQFLRIFTLTYLLFFLWLTRILK